MINDTVLLSSSRRDLVVKLTSFCLRLDVFCDSFLRERPYLSGFGWLAGRIWKALQAAGMSYWNERLHRAASFIRAAASPTFPAIPTASSTDNDPGRSHRPGLEDLRRMLGETQRELAPILDRQQAGRYELSRMMANVLPARPVQILDTVPDNASSSDDSDDDTKIIDFVRIRQVQWF